MVILKLQIETICNSIVVKCNLSVLEVMTPKGYNM